MEKILQNGSAAFALGIGEKPEMSDADVLEHVLATDADMKCELDHIRADSELCRAFNFAAILNARIETTRIELRRRRLH